MGYRSEVYLGVIKEQKNEFDKLNKDNYFELIEETDSHSVYKGEYLKWYDSYEDVIKFNALIYSNENNFSVAIGEDNETHSTIGEWYNYIEVITFVNIL